MKGFTLSLLLLASSSLGCAAISSCPVASGVQTAVFGDVRNREYAICQGLSEVDAVLRVKAVLRRFDGDVKPSRYSVGSTYYTVYTAKWDMNRKYCTFSAVNGRIQKVEIYNTNCDELINAAIRKELTITVEE